MAIARPFSAPFPESEIVGALRAAGCVFAEEEARLLVSAGASAEELAAMVDRRAAGMPLEHILGWAEFCGLRIAVGPRVFVPRRRSEYLVEQAMAVTAPHSVALDLCCGCGALGAALAAGRDIRLYASDIDPTAVAYSRRNLGCLERVFEGDLFDPLPESLRGAVDVVLCNTPYVPSEALRMLPAEARLHEPKRALDGGPDGLDVQRRVAAGAPTWLRRGGHLLVEVSEHQAPITAEIFASNGLTPRIAHSVEREATVVLGRLE